MITFLDDVLRTNSKLSKWWTKAGYATKSSGRLKPPLRFIYWLKARTIRNALQMTLEDTHRYFRLRITWTSPLLFPSTFLPLVVSKPQKPIVFIISISSGDLPSRSASDTWTLSEILDFDDDGNGERERCLRSYERDRLWDLLEVNFHYSMSDIKDTNEQKGNVLVKKNIWWMVNTLHFKTLRGWVHSFIHLDFRLEPPAPRKSLSRLGERFRRSRLFDRSLCFRFDRSRSFARFRRTGDIDLLLLLERPICEYFSLQKGESKTFVYFMRFERLIVAKAWKLQWNACQYTTTHIEAPKLSTENHRKPSKNN